MSAAHAHRAPDGVHALLSRPMRRSLASHRLHTARLIGSLVADFCGLLVAVAIALALMGAP